MMMMFLTVFAETGTKKIKKYKSVKSGAVDAGRRILKPSRGLTGETDGSDPACGLGCRAWVLPKPCGFCILWPVRLSAPCSLCLSVPLSNLTRQQSPAVCAAGSSLHRCAWRAIFPTSSLCVLARSASGGGHGGLSSWNWRDWSNPLAVEWSNA